MTKGEFGGTLRAERERLHISQDALATQLGVSQQAVANWENGISHPRRNHRAKLVEILGRGSPLAHPPPPPANFLAQYTKPERAVVPSVVPSSTIDRARRQSPQEMQDTDELRAALPPGLHPHIGAGISIGATHRRLDYLSDRVGAEIKRVPGDWLRTWHSFAPEMLSLSMVRQTTHLVLPDRKYILLVVQDDATPGQALQRIMFDGGVLGIWVTPVRTVTEAGQLIQRIETSDFNSPDDLDIGAHLSGNGNGSHP